MDLTKLIIIFCASVVSSSFGTLVGGSSLITIPLLILMGLPPHTAIGTDRIGTMGIGLAGLYSFHRKGIMNYRLAFIFGIPCLLGGFIGANLALQISPELLKKFIVVLTVILLIVMVANPRLGVVNGSYEAPPNHRKTRFRRLFEPCGGHLRWLLWSRSGDFPILHLNSRFPSDLSGKCC
jgi:uncharacterized membrane protein YfcA